MALEPDSEMLDIDCNHLATIAVVIDDGKIDIIGSDVDIFNTDVTDSVGAIKIEVNIIQMKISQCFTDVG
jgi:hypothetical protein